jgi:ABC-type glutathione transport system ATPase component
VLIADEPSSALDVTSQKMVIKMLMDMMERGIIQALIFITHELPLLYHVTDDIMVMYAGQIVEKGTSDEIVFDPIHPDSKALMGSIIVPEAGLRDVKLTAIPGTPTSRTRRAVVALPSGVRLPCHTVAWGISPCKTSVADAPTVASSQKKTYERRITMQANSILSGKGLTKVFGFGATRTVAVDHVDFDFKKGRSSPSWGNPAVVRPRLPRCSWGW